MELLKQSLSIFVSFSLFLNQCLYAADLPIEVDTTAAAKYQATLDKAPNGVQIVNIVNPNSQGMSHNKFKEYNVNPKGLILNNSKAVVNTQLAGYISYNPNLTNNASVILNEVTGTNKSLLKGYSEVAGVKADVIVSNPNGITVNGGGFINTNKATLTTGRPSFLNGFVNGFDITQGQILIDGDGFNANNINKVELYSKALQVNAKFYADNLKVATGDNFVDLNGNVTSKETLGSGVSIDSSLLGGIYANRIELISSDKGVGVNLPPEVFAQDSIVLNSAGDIVLGKVTDAEGNNISKVTANDITMSADKIENNREVTAKNTINVTANSVTSNGFFNSELDLTFNVNTLDNYATLFSGNDMYLYVKNSLYNHEASNILAMNNLSIGKDTQKTNLIINKKANIETINGDMTIYANELQNITDTPLKEDVYVSTETLDTASNPAIGWAVNQLGKEGKLHTKTEQVYKTNVCINGTGEGGCEFYANGYINSNTDSPTYYDVTADFINSTLVYSVQSYVAGYGWGTGENPEKYPIYRKTIKYVNASDVLSKLNTYFSKFGVQTIRKTVNIFNYSHFNIYPGFTYKSSNNSEVRRIATITTKDEKIDTIPNPATILSAGKMNLYVNNTKNYLSQIASNDTLNLEGDSLNNNGETLYRKNTLTGRYEYQSRSGGWFHSAKYDWADLPSSTTYQTIGQKYSSISSAKGITGGLAVVNNIDIKSNQAPYGSTGSTLKLDETLDSVKIDSDTGKVKIQLPKSEFGLFIYSKDQNYLVEKNPAFTSYDTFVSSDYMLGKLNYKPEETIKHLGDASYENKLVRESVFTQSGKRYLASNITSDAQQFTYLMDNALALQKDLQLTPGISLSKEQIANLTKDIVWMEEKVVNGQTVLVPVVYLSNIDNKNASLILANDDIKLNTTNLVNAGTIQSGNSLIVNAQGDILNAGGNLLASNDLNLDATNITNLSSTMQGNSLNITSDKFTSDVATKDIIRNLDNGVEKNTLVSEASNIISNTNVNIQTKEDINLIGTNVKAKEDVNLTSQNGNVNIASKETTNSFDNTTKTGYLKESKTEQLSSNVEANNLNINGNNITVQASNITANENLNLIAKENVIIQEATNQNYLDLKHELKGGFFGGKLKLAQTKDTKTIVSSILKANNVNITSKDTNLIASQIIANEAQITADILTLMSKKDLDYESYLRDSSGFITKTLTSKGHIKENVVEAIIKTNKLVLNSKDITNQLRADTLVKTLSSQYDLNIEQIKLIKQIATSKEWDVSTTSLTGVGQLIVATIVAVCTAGAGAALTGAASTSLQATVVQSLVTGITNQLVTSAITGNSFKLDAKSLVLGAISAGVMSYANTMIDSSLGLDKIKPSDMSFTQHVEKIAAKTVLKSTVNSAVYGTSFENSFKSALGSEIQADLSSYIGDSYFNKDLNYVTHKLAHIGSGAIGAAIAGNDIASGALGAVTGEVIGEAVGTSLIKDGNFSNEDKNLVKLTSSLGTIFTAGIAGKDVETAYNSSDVAVENNTIYLLKNKVVATDGINNHKVVALTGKEALSKGLGDNYLESTIEKINPEDTSKYNNVYDLTNKKDFEVLRKDTDMNYNNIDKNTKIVFENGMMNDYKDATKLQDMIQKDFPNSSIGLINNETGKITGVLNDAVEWLPNYYTTKDVLNAYQLQQLSPNAIIITHSAGNEDIYKANNVNALVNAQTPYYLISAGSPKSKSELEKSASKVGAVVITQINHPNDPVANGWLNGDANYNIDFSQKIPIWDDLKNNHPFTNYYYNEGVKEEIQKAINK